MARTRISAAALLLAVTCAWGADDSVTADPSELVPPDPASAYFLKLDGPAATLKWKDRLTFRISDESYQRLTTASKKGPLYLRIYAGTADQLKRKQGRDPYDCIPFFYLERTQIRLTLPMGIHTLETDVSVARAWFDDTKDMHVMAVVDEGKLPEPFTRIHYTLVAAYFDSGMQLTVQAQSIAKETVNTGWRGSSAPKKAKPPAADGAPTVRPSPKETVYRGDLMSYVAGSHMDIRDMETRQVDRINLTEHQVDMRDPSIKVGERVLAVVVEDTPRRVSLWRSFYPECIRPAIQTAIVDPGVTLMAMVQHCEITEGLLVNASPQ